MEIQKILNKNKYIGKIIYYSNNFNCPASKRYALTIEKDGKIFINRSNFTYSEAETFFNRWVNKQK